MTPASTIWSGPSGLVPAGRKPLIGDVAEFDEPRGLGVIEYGTGDRIPFHCTAITDGSRRIDVGTVVAFEVAAGRLGRLEARSVRPLPGVVPPGSTLDHEEPGFDVPFELPGREALRRELERYGQSAAEAPGPTPPSPTPPAPPIGRPAQPPISLPAQEVVLPPVSMTPVSETPVAETGATDSVGPDPAAPRPASRWPVDLPIEPTGLGGRGVEIDLAEPQSPAAPAPWSVSVSAELPDPVSPDSGPVDPEGSAGAGEGSEDAEGEAGDATPPFGTSLGAPVWAVAPPP
ncbi:MAG TPA: hypothetical protein VII46_02045, partial [Acidimicrobiales bacterium]